jgi:Protein of unknown function (DUF5672)
MPSLSVTCIETKAIDKAVAAIERTLACVEVKSIYWISTAPLPKQTVSIEVVNLLINDFTDFAGDINQLYLQIIPKIVTTDFNLIVQCDGFAVNRQAWSDEFWNYDYIGAPWPWMWGSGPPWNGPIVGNGGFSLRSRKLYQALNELCIDWRVDRLALDPRGSQREYFGFLRSGERFVPEDVLICLWYREILETQYGIKFCDPDLASQFSVETVHPSMTKWLGKSFGFHGVRAAPYYGVTL